MHFITIKTNETAGQFTPGQIAFSTQAHVRSRRYAGGIVNRKNEKEPMQLTTKTSHFLQRQIFQRSSTILNSSGPLIIRRVYVYT
ncbi:hypothetical protein CEXT_189631 [Caerostris extrusa]|uniref:Uncharacterized protein n=1 Tax=Caerostris extrusa TaxID=172846 RepID=A0AAV4X0N4_CAEEX|nr:hypothetical protein CEXT_189631 [Caerostris extrusa]